MQDAEIPTLKIDIPLGAVCLGWHLFLFAFDVDHLNILSVTRHILQLEGFLCETLSEKSRNHSALHFSDSKAGKLYEAIKQNNIVL